MKRNDIILFVCILAVAALLFGLGALKKENGEAARVVICVKGEKKQQSYVLTEDTTVNIEGPLGVNRLVISDGNVWMEEAACPDHYCMKQGEITKAGQQIICLPNGIVVEIVGGESLPLDATVY